MLSLSHRIIQSQAIRRSLFGRTAIAGLKIKVVPHEEEACEETVEERNIRLGREMSPHLSIYKPQLTSILSISHRISGVALATIVSAFGIGALTMSHDFAHYHTMIDGLELGAPLLISLKALLSFPVAYHTCNGIRHLIWDTGKFLKIKEVYTTGYAMLAATLIVTAGLCAM